MGGGRVRRNAIRMRNSAHCGCCRKGFFRVSRQSPSALLIAAEVSPRANRAGPSAWPVLTGRWAGRLQGQRRAPKARPAQRDASTVDAGATGPDNARRSGRLALTSSQLVAHSREADGLSAVLAIKVLTAFTM